MRHPGRPKPVLSNVEGGEYRSAQHEGTAVSVAHAGDATAAARA